MASRAAPGCSGPTAQPEYSNRTAVREAAQDLRGRRGLARGCLALEHRYNAPGKDSAAHCFMDCSETETASPPQQNFSLGFNTCYRTSKQFSKHFCLYIQIFVSLQCSKPKDLSSRFGGGVFSWQHLPTIIPTNGCDKPTQSPSEIFLTKMLLGNAFLKKKKCFSATGTSICDVKLQGQKVVLLV